MRENPLWYICGGPKNNGRFAYIDGHRLLIGLNHKPMTRNSRMRFLNMHKQQDRRDGHAHP